MGQGSKRRGWEERVYVKEGGRMKEGEGKGGGTVHKDPHTQACLPRLLVQFLIVYSKDVNSSLVTGAAEEGRVQTEVDTTQAQKKVLVSYKMYML